MDNAGGAGFLAGAAALTVALRYLAHGDEARRVDKERAFDKQASAAVVTVPFLASGPAAEVEHLTVPHLREFYGDSLETFDNPLLSRMWPRNLNFVAEAEEVIATQVVKPSTAGAGEGPTPRASAVRAFVAAGPTSQIYWNPKTVKCAIVTCGGLCPGLNTVVREIVMALHYVYGVSPGSVYGVQNGYRGFYELPWRTLTPDGVSAIHTQGGTVLGSSRGGFDLERILASLVDKGVGIVFVIGGDGTHRGALALLKGASARGMKLTVACVPKTIDNDIAIVDRTFGFDTAVQEAVRPIECAHTEARASQNGVGLVKLMGRASGFIALTASMASRDVNVTLLPEAPWKLASLLEYLETRLERRGHCLIVVAEGAESVEQKEAKASGAGKPRMDESGNVLPDDVGVYIKDAITAHFKRINTPCTVKYIDPSYIIRSSPPNSADSNLCTSLAFNAVHGAFSGRTGFTVGTVDNAFVLLPITVISSLPPRTVDITSRMYARLCITTGQPNLG